VLDHEETEAAGDSSIASPDAAGVSISSNQRLQVLSQTNIRVSKNVPTTTLYRVSGAVRRDRVSALESPFTKLLKDFKALPQ